MFWRFPENIVLPLHRTKQNEKPTFTYYFPSPRPFNIAITTVSRQQPDMCRQGLNVSRHISMSKQCLVMSKQCLHVSRQFKYVSRHV